MSLNLNAFKQPGFNAFAAQGAKKPAHGAEAQAGSGAAAAHALRPAQAVTPIKQTQAAAGVDKAAGGDQLAQFKQQLQSGAIRTNLNAPAKPFTASKAWSA